MACIKNKGEEYSNKKFVTKFDGVTTVGLLVTLTIIYVFQGDIIVEKPLYVLLTAIPLVLKNIISYD